MRGSVLWGAVALAGLLNLAASVAANAQVAASTFDYGPDGWAGACRWKAAGGHPAGHLRYVFSGPAPTDIVAPVEFLGDWSPYDGLAIIVFDHRVFGTGDNVNFVFPYSIHISGPGGSATWTGTRPTGTTPWITQHVPIRADAWRLDRGTWSGLLRNVGKLAIRIELFSNAAGRADDDGIDNVRIDVLSAALRGMPSPGAGQGAKVIR